ncbi:P18 [Epinotia aporema granulovirus]|uniref:p18 n=1 Tax=Epinotia aporema granulovirus TaxID=166056 RepID=K4EQF0_9BBAC|nr:P18 [Epinotia aporema granulovirus]AER41513.1 P18 [Epinotia aporema granulovirus]
MAVNLYTFKPSVFCTDSDDTTDEFLIQGLSEALQDDTKSKLACFLELKREEVVLIKKVHDNLLNKCNGDYYKNHVLLDVLVLYKKYSEEYGDDTAFGQECVSLSRELVISAFSLFNNATDIVVFVESRSDSDDVINLILLEMHDLGILKLEKVFVLPH